MKTSQYKFHSGYIKEVDELSSLNLNYTDATYIWQPIVLNEKNETSDVSCKMEIQGSLLLPEGICLNYLVPCGVNCLIGRDQKGHYLCIDTLTGSVKWQKEASISHSPGVYSPEDGLFYAGCDNGELIAIDPQTGDINWSLKMSKNSGIFSSLLQQGDLLIFHFRNTLFAVNRNSQKTEWRCKVQGDMGVSGLMVWQGRLIACSVVDGEQLFHLIDMQTGQIQKSVTTSMGLINDQPGIVTDKYIWFLTNKNTIGRFSPETGMIEEIKSSYFSKENQPEPIYTREIYLYDRTIWFRPDLNCCLFENEGIYTCDEKGEISRISTSGEGLDIHGVISHDTIYTLQPRHYRLISYSFKENSLCKLHLPNFSGNDLAEAMVVLSDNTILLAQCGGEENQERQILYVIK